jgi:hypothetical protein
MFAGIPLLPGANNFDQLHLIVEMLGDIPTSVIESGNNKDMFYVTELDTDSEGEVRYRLKSYEEFSEQTG